MRTRGIAIVVAALGVAAAARAQSTGGQSTGDGSDRRDDRPRREERRERSSVEREPAGRDASRPQDARSQAAGAQQGRPARMEDEFKVLLDRSIFARTGTAASAARAATTSTAPAAPPPLSPEQAVVFRGVLAQDNEYIAFAENLNTAQLMILRTGDDVARGKIVAITLDTMAYGTGGDIKVVHVGHNLVGELVSPVLASGGAPTTGPAGTPGTSARPPTATPSSPEQAAILERLRQRRNSGQ